jgi:hypothetical protein
VRAEAETADPPGGGGAPAQEPRRGTRGDDLVAARRELAEDFYRRQGWDPEDIASHLRGIDFEYPVEEVTLRRGQVLEQWQYPSNPQGDYYALPGADRNTLGITHSRRNRATGLMEERVLRRFVVTEDTPVLRSTTAAFSWGTEVARGGGTQLVTRNKGTIQPFTGR